MSGHNDPFLDACDLTAPPELEWDDWVAGEPVRRRFDRPAVLIGRNPEGDLALDHPDVSRRHAYLQAIEGRLYAIDLESRDGLRWGGVPRRSGWLDRGRPMQLGPIVLRVGGAGPSAGPVAGPGPLSRRFVSRRPLPEVVLEVRPARGDPTRRPMDRVLMLVGSSPLCTIPLPGEDASRFACALVRTPAGVWAVDLLSSRGVTINGAACRDAWLDDGDLIRIGDHAIRLTYGATRPDGPAALPAPLGATAGPGLASTTGGPGWELIPELILRQLPDRDGPLPDPASAPFDRVLVMLIRLISEMHRDHLEVVRTEMEQIRRLNEEMAALRSQSPPPPAPVARPGAGAERPRASAHRPPGSLPAPASDPAHAPAPPERLDPREVQAIVGKRLAAWEKERQSRWRKVVDLLIRP